MTDNVKISVIIATFNGAPYIEEQIQSILGQRLLPSEIIVSDDGSTDATVSIVEKLSACSPVPFEILRNSTRLGYANNFLQATSAAKGEWIALCDQDDVWRPDKLAVCSEYMMEASVVAIAHDYSDLVAGKVQEAESGKGRRRVLRTEVMEPLTKQPWHAFMGHSLLVRSDLVAAIPFGDRPEWASRPGLQEPHDDWLSFLALSLGRVATVAEPLVYYRRHETNASRELWIQSTPWQRLKRATGSLEYFRRGTEQQARRAQLLTSLINSPRWTDAARRAASHHERLAGIALLRLVVRTHPRMTGRLEAFVRLLLQGSYQRSTARPAKEASVDLLFALGFLARLRRKET